MSAPHDQSDGYSGWDATQYDVSGAFVWELGADLVKLLDPQPGEDILDIGCGTGHLAARIAEAGAEVLAIDVSPSMIEQAKRNYPFLRFEVIDAHEIAPGRQFEGVFSNASLHWINEPEMVASRIFGALKSGGRFVTEFGGRGNISAIIASIRRALEQVGSPVVGPDPWYFPGADEYTSLLERLGFTVKLAQLFHRPTPLGKGEEGLRAWLEMFPKPLMKGLSDSERGRVFRTVEEELRATMFKDGTWWGDYVRIRVVAHKME